MIFDRPKGKAKQDEDADEGASNLPNKNKQQREGSLMATVDRKGSEARRVYPGPLREAARRAMPEPCFPRQAAIQGPRPHEAVLVQRLQQGGA